MAWNTFNSLGLNSNSKSSSNRSRITENTSDWILFRNLCQSWHDRKYFPSTWVKKNKNKIYSRAGKIFLIMPTLAQVSEKTPIRDILSDSGPIRETFWILFDRNGQNTIRLDPIQCKWIWIHRIHLNWKLDFSHG